MIRIQYLRADQTPVYYTLTPTIFPDKTSQVWKLPEELVAAKAIVVSWFFEAEREILDLLSLRKLLPPQSCAMVLEVPYLPYARQDKDVSNDSTFNLYVLADLLNSMHLVGVRSVDAHNPELCAQVIDRFSNVRVDEIHQELIERTKPDYLVFPDLGAKNRYFTRAIGHVPRIICYKERDQATGEILRHTMSYRDLAGMTIQGVNMGRIAKPGDRFLIIDDLCDGGATFLSVAKSIRAQVPDIFISLFVTHGLFSKGREALLVPGGIDFIHTTNSLLKNPDGVNVCLK